MELERIQQLARKAHGGQLYGGVPYWNHLLEVVALLKEFGFTEPEYVATGFLHDVLEDSRTTPGALLEEGVTPLVVQAVLFCTDEPGPDRKTRKTATYQRVLADKAQGGFGVRVGLVVKFADRLANLHSSRMRNPRLFRMYRKEAAAFLHAYLPTDSLGDDSRFQAMVQNYRQVTGV